MGSDKALLPLPGTGFLLWQQQLRTLEALQPAEIFWSGPKRPDLPGHVRLVSDSVPNAGPLAGVSACLDLLPSDLLVVLAIDLPGMNATFLKSLLAKCSPICGAVMQRGDFFEPLAAIYPKELAALAREHLQAGRYAMQDFVRVGIERELMKASQAEPEDDILFKNLNTPWDLHPTR